MQTVLTSLLILAAGAYCLRRAGRALTGRSSGCGKCQSCPVANASSMQNGNQPTLVQLGSLSVLPKPNAWARRGSFTIEP